MVTEIGAEVSKDCSISELISFLKTAYDPMDFEKVERMLKLREEKLKLDKEALEAKMKGNLGGLKVELKEELEVYRTRCSELEEKSNKAQEVTRVLSMELENKKKECVSLGDKLGKLESSKLSIEDELKEYKRMCIELKDQLTCLEECYQVACERKKRAQERNTTLSEELKKMEQDMREKCGQLKAENKYLECEKRVAENEVEFWKKRYAELESRVVRLEEEILVFRGRDPQFPVKLKAEPGDLTNKVSYEDKENKEATPTSKIQDNANGEINGSGLVPLPVKEKMLNCNDTTNTSADIRPTFLSPVRGSGQLQVAGPPSIGVLDKTLVNAKDVKKKISLETEVQFGTQVRKRLWFEQEGSSNKKIATSLPGSARSASSGVIEISDSDDEMDTTPMPFSDIRDKGTTSTSVDCSLKGALDKGREMTSQKEREMNSQKCLKRTLSDQRGRENKISNKENSQFTLTPKRKWAANIITSDSKVDNDDDDKILMAKPKVKKLEELEHESVGSVNRCSVAPIVSPMDDNAKESITLSKQHLVSLRQCKEKTSPTERSSPSHLRMSGTKYQISANATAENAEIHEAEVVRSCESLGGPIVNRFDSSDGEDSSSDSEDVMDRDLAFDQIILRIQRNRDNKLEWSFEADMLSCFQKDHELCMKAVCALYRQQTAEEKSVKGLKGSSYSNTRGFSKFDALRGTTLAEFLMNGDSQGGLKRSVKELEEYDPKALEECRRLASHYSGQLFKIYQNKEDPFFP